LDLEKLIKLFYAVDAYIWKAETQHTMSSDEDVAYYNQELVDLRSKVKQALEECKQ